MLADRAFGDRDTPPGFENRGNLSRGATRQFQAELAGFLQQLRVATHDAQIGAQWWTEPVEAMLAIGADPAIERHARIGPLAAIWMLVRLVSELAHQAATFGRCEPWVRHFANNTETEQSQVFAWIAHTHLRVPSGNEHHPIRSAPPRKGRASVGPQRTPAADQAPHAPESGYPFAKARAGALPGGSQGPECRMFVVFSPGQQHRRRIKPHCQGHQRSS